MAVDFGQFCLVASRDAIIIIIPYSGVIFVVLNFRGFPYLSSSWFKPRNFSDVTPMDTPQVKMADFFECECMVRGYHKYKDVWEAEVGTTLFNAKGKLAIPTIFMPLRF